MARAGRVIVGVGQSPRSLPALRLALELARDDGALLVAVHAWTPPGGDLAERRAPCAELRRVWKAEAGALLADALDAAWGTQSPAGVTVRTLVQRGDPGRVLAQVAFSPDDLLVVGTGRRGLVGRLTGGRVTRRCLASAVCPVMAVPPPTLARGAGHGLARHRQVSMDDVLREWGHPAA